MGCAASAPVIGHSSSATSVAGESQRCFHDEYMLGSKLGKGGFSQVRSARSTALSDVANGGECAVKIIDLRKEDKDSSEKNSRLSKIDSLLRKEAVCEATVWKRAGQHKFIVPLTDAFMDTNLCYFVMEKCDMSLRMFLEQGAGGPTLDEEGLSKVFSNMLTATSHIHSKGIAHRDIKPDNFLAKDGVVKMCDFGLAEILPSHSNAEHPGLTGVFGTAPFMSPEMLKDNRYDEKTDLWSLGALAYVLLYGQFPYTPTERNASAMKRSIRDGKAGPNFKPYRVAEGTAASESAASFVRALLSRDPKTRASADDAMQMPLFTRPRVGNAAPMSLMLRGAIKAGAFESRRTDVKDAVDPLLSALQQKYQGVDLDSPYTSTATTATLDGAGLKGYRQVSPSDTTSTGLSSNASSSNAFALSAMGTDRRSVPC